MPCFQKQASESVLKENILKILPNSQENICTGVSFFDRVAGDLSTVKTPFQVLSCVYWGIFKKTFSTEHIEVTASALNRISLSLELSTTLTGM